MRRLDSVRMMEPPSKMAAGSPGPAEAGTPAAARFLNVPSVATLISSASGLMFLRSTPPERFLV